MNEKKKNLQDNYKTISTLECNESTPHQAIVSQAHQAMNYTLQRQLYNESKEEKKAYIC